MAFHRDEMEYARALPWGLDMIHNDFDWLRDIYKIDRAIRQSAGQSLEALLDVSLSQAKIIEKLNKLGKLTQVQLAGHLQCDCGFLSRLIARMVEKGLLAKEQHERDGRCSTISLTELGSQKGAQIRACVRDAERHYTSVLNGEETRRLALQLKRLLENSKIASIE